MAKRQTMDTAVTGRVTDTAVAQGYAALSRDDVRGALGQLLQSLDSEPQRVELLNDCGGLHGLLGEHEEAVGFFLRALALAPERTDVLNNLGLALAGLDRHQEAIAYLTRALDLQPDFLDALCNLGFSLCQLGRYAQALEKLDRALRINPAHVGALCNRGFALAGLGRAAEALECFREVLRLDARHVGALTGSGAALVALGRALEAVGPLQLAVDINPNHVSAQSNLGAALARLSRHAEALARFDRVLAREPEHLDARLNKASLLQQIHRLDESLETLQPVLDRHPHHVAALLTHSAILGARNRDTEALACIERVLAHQPDNLTAISNLGSIELAAGDLIQGFRHKEVRWQTGTLVSAYRGEAPLWLGQEALQGKTILLHHEQGLGDTLQFVRYAPLVAQRGARVILSVQSPLRELLASLPGVSVLLGDGDPLPDHDFQCPLMSLPVAFATTLDSIPPMPRIEPDPRRVAVWRARLGPHSRPRIGLVWAGRQHPPVNVPRDMSLPLLLPLLAKNAQWDTQFISLQKDVPTADAGLLRTLPGLLRLGEDLENFAATAALVANLDLVIAVDTAVAHLAGLLGKPVWIMNRFASCWRWLRDGRTSSPWYPSARLFRQPSFGNWEAVVQEVGHALESFVGQWQAPAQHAGAAALRQEGGAEPNVSAVVAAHRAGELNNTGLRLWGLGRHQEALDAFEQALTLDGAHVNALLNRGIALARLERHATALESFQQVLAIEPGHVNAQLGGAAAVLALDRPAEALEWVERLLRIDPQHINAHRSRWRALGRLKRYEEALESLDRVLAQAPRDLEALLDRARILHDLGRFEAALESTQTALESDPDCAPALSAQAAVLWGLNRNAEARVFAERALALQPDYAAARCILGFIELGDGNLPAGFLHQESRWQLEQAKPYAYHGEAPLWLGKESLEGKTIVLHYEQGLGDTLQLVRYAPLVAQRGGQVILSVQPHLRELLASLPGMSAVLSEEEPLPPHDFHCPLMSLPLVFGTTLDSIPGGVPYVQADPERVQEWRERLGPPQRPRIGIVWAGRQGVPPNIPRDMRLHLLLLLFSIDAEFISLQRQVPEADAALLDGLPALKPLGQTLENFADTAALVAHLDLIITVDSAVAHLAGAMDIPVWVMNRRASCWRWLRDGRTDSLWYPSVRLFRQPALGDWESVVKDVRVALEIFVRQWRAPPAGQGLAVPPSAAGWMRRAGLRTREGDTTGAINCYSEVLKMQPADTAALSALGVTLGLAGFSAEALTCFEKALNVTPDSADLWCKCGVALLELSREEEALLNFDKALEIDSQHGLALLYRGLALARLGRPREALASLDEALGQDPGHADTRYQRSLILLQLGSYSEGFRELESRRQLASMPTQPPPSAAPVWLGEAPAPRGTLLVHHEHRLTDALLMARLIPQVARLWGTVLLDFPPELAPLLEQNFADLANVQVLAPGTALPPHSHRCPVMSLPLALGMDAVPVWEPYLKASPELIPLWHGRLASTGRLRVGMAWRGWPAEGSSSVQLQDLATVLDLAADFILLQDELTEEERGRLASIPSVRICGTPLKDFSHAAALIATLDLVLAADMAVAHLAAALGKPAWVLLPRAGHWCWPDGGSASPWYPIVKLFRQGPQGEWAPVVTQVRSALGALLTGAAPGPGGPAGTAGTGTAQAFAPDAGRADALNNRAPVRTQVRRAVRALLTGAAPVPSGPAGTGAAQVLVPDAERADALNNQDTALTPEKQADALNSRGLELWRDDRPEEALESFEKALLIDGKRFSALFNRGIALAYFRLNESAIASFQQALAIRPGRMHRLLKGYSNAVLGTPEQVFAWLEGALALGRTHMDAQLREARILLSLGQFGEALQAVDKVLAMRSNHVDTLYLRGAILWWLNRNAEARKCLERVLATNPGRGDALYILGSLALAEGDLVAGFLHHEIRWQLDALKDCAYQGAAPLWLGQQSLKGKVLLLHREQGLGDTLQFVRYAALAAQRGARVMLHVQPSLRELLSNMPGVSTVTCDGEALPPHDFYCPLLSLPVAFGTTLTSIPSTPYIRADAGRVEEWRERLGLPARPRIGLVWAGRQSLPRNVSRDMSLRHLLTLLTIDAEFISLQKEVPEADAALLATAGIKPLGEALESFADTAALVASLDLLISVDTATAHLAGAMGVPVWLMNRFASCWRWMRDGRADSPWYPTMRIFRQPALRDWESVVNDVKVALEDFVLQWGAPPAESWLPAEPTVAGLMRRASVRARDGDMVGAVNCYTELLKAEPENTTALSELGLILGRAGYQLQALACFDKALGVTPGNVELLCKRAVALLELSREEEALLCLDKALRADPGHLLARLHHGLALARLGRLPEALASFDQTLDQNRAKRLDPGHAAVRYHRGLVLLQLGRYGEGFRALESRWDMPAMGAQSSPTGAASWLGAPAASGGTLLVHHEQTLADALLLARYIPQVASLWRKVLVRCPAELARLLEDSFASLSNVKVLASGVEPAHSHHCPMMSLPLACHTELASVPAPVPYLQASAELIEIRRRRVVSTGRLRVGIAWRDRLSEGPLSFQLADLLPLLDLAADFIPLQTELTDKERDSLAGLAAVRLGEAPIQDLCDAAALIETLDLVLAPDTAVAHLAAALGKPTWVLLSRGGSWRWLEGRVDSPWYPAARVFRQTSQGGWGAAVSEARSLLGTQLAGAGAA